MLNLVDFKDVTLILTSFSTVIISILTFKKWKVEYRGKAYFDAAIKFKKAAYNLRDNFNVLRAGFISPSEMHPESNPREASTSEHEAYVINNRLKTFNVALNELYTIRPEMEAYFGKTATDLCNNMNWIVGLYHGSVNEYLQLINNTNNLDYFGSVRMKVFISTNNDEYQNRMNAEVEKIESLVHKYTIFKN